MAKRIGTDRRGLGPFVMAIALCASGVALSQVSTNSASAWSFGESPTKAFAVDGFAGTNGEGTRVTQVLEDESGNIFRVGTTAGTVDVDPGAGTTFVGDGDTDAVSFVAKYSAYGDFLWAYDWKPVTTNELLVQSAAIGPGGYLVVGGNLRATTGFDLDPTSGTDSETTTSLDPFILRLNADGSYGWGSTFPVTGGGDVGLPALFVSTTGAITAAFNFEGSLSLPGSTVTSAGRNDIAIARFDANLSTKTWHTTIAGADQEVVNTLASSLDGKVFVTGQFSSANVTVTDAAATPSTVTRSGSAATNSYFVSLSGDGLVQYAVPRSLGATNNYPNAASVSPTGTLFAQLNTGELVEVSTSGVITNKGNSNFGIRNMSFVASGHLVAVGVFNATVDFDPGVGTENRTSAAGSDDGFVLNLASDFTFRSVQVFATTTLDEVNSITPSLENGYLISGLTLGTSLNLSNTEYAGTYTRSAGADSFGFVIRYDASGTSGVTTTTTTTTTLTTPAAVVTTTTVPAVAAPTRVSYVTGNKKVVVKWGAVSGASGYTVVSASGATLCSVNTTSCRLASLKNGKMYTVRVKSKNSAGVVSANATTLKVIPGFALKIATYKVKKTPLLTSIVATPSKGAKKWRLVSGKCAIRSGRLVAPKTAGTCRLQLSVAKTKSYPAMATTIAVAITR
jgi:hypothetical protein